MGLLYIVVHLLQFYLVNILHPVQQLNFAFLWQLGYLIPLPGVIHIMLFNLFELFHVLFVLLSCLVKP